MSGADVIVVGGGPAGASAAWHLARAGARVLVLDRARFPRGKPCAEYLSPEASRILHAMGALEACERAGGAQLAGMVVHAPNGVAMRGDFAAAHGFTGFRDRGLSLRRELLDVIVLDRAREAGARVREGMRVTDVLRDARRAACGVRTMDATGTWQEFRAPLVVGADGLRSVVARRLGLARRTAGPRRIAFVAHLRGVSAVGDCGEMHVACDGYAGIADVGGGVTNVAVVVPARRAHEAAGDPAAFFHGWLAAHPALAARVSRAERVDAVRATGPFAARARRAWAPGALLVGDAADFYDPFTGEGIYAALRGGQMAAPALLDALGARDERRRHQALASYHHARRAAFAGKWRVERLVALAVAVPALMNRAARVLARRKDLADLLVGVAGDFVPPSAVLSPRFFAHLLFS